MFRFYLTLIYILSNIYVYFRIRGLFIRKPFRKWYTIIYIGIIIILPNLELYAHWDKGIAGQVISSVSWYILPFYLYVFLLLLLFDLFLLFNRTTRIIPSGVIQCHSFRLYAFTFIMLISVTIVILGVINLHNIRISEYQIEIPRRNAKTDHLRIAFVSDFHIKTSTSVGFIRQYVSKVNALNADLVLYGGDLLEGSRNNEIDEKFESELRRVHARLGLYGVPGNHEFYARQQKSDFFRKSGIILLCDTVIKIDDLFYLAGRYDELHENRKKINELLEPASGNLPVILVDHRPTQIMECSRTKVDVQFSGHTHNGQLFPLNLVTRMLYELAWGYRKIGRTHFFVSSGLRLWGPPVKTAGKSEIMVVDVNFKTQN